MLMLSAVRYFATIRLFIVSTLLEAQMMWPGRTPHVVVGVLQLYAKPSRLPWPGALSAGLGFN